MAMTSWSKSAVFIFCARCGVVLHGDAQVCRLAGRLRLQDWLSSAIKGQIVLGGWHYAENISLYRRLHSFCS